MRSKDDDVGTRRTPDELATLYEIEPTLAEIVTEGHYDAALIRWFIQLIGSDAVVYSVDDRIIVTEEEIKAAGEIPGNRGAVVTAATLFAHEAALYAVPSADVLRRVTFIYDRDDDLLTGRNVPDTECMLVSDYTSMEMYCFAERPVGKMLRIPLRAPASIEASEVITGITQGLLEIAALRHILRTIGMPTALISDITSRCEVRGVDLVVNIRGLADASINKKGGPSIFGSTLNQVIDAHAEFMAKLTVDPRMVIRGHDYTEMLCFYLKTRFPEIFRGPDRLPLKTSKLFENILITCLELSDLAKEQLFLELTNRYSPAEAGEAA